MQGFGEPGLSCAGDRNAPRLKLIQIIHRQDGDILLDAVIHQAPEAVYVPVAAARRSRDAVQGDHQNLLSGFGRIDPALGRCQGGASCDRPLRELERAC